MESYIAYFRVHGPIRFWRH